MSYSFTVTKKDGVVTVRNADNDYTPDNAEWIISGHEDANNINVSVYRKQVDASETLAYAGIGAKRTVTTGGGTA